MFDEFRKEPFVIISLVQSYISTNEMNISTWHVCLVRTTEAKRIIQVEWESNPHLPITSWIFYH